MITFLSAFLLCFFIAAIINFFIWFCKTDVFWRDNSVYATITKICAILAIPALIFLVTMRVYIQTTKLESKYYNLEQIADTYKVYYHDKENISEPYIEYRETILGIYQYDYYIPQSARFDKFKKTDM